MNLAQFQDHMRKRKNGALDDTESKELFDRMLAAPDAIVDEKGPTPRLQKRVAVVTKDLVAERDATSRSRGYSAKGAEKRKATMADVTAHEKRMADDEEWIVGQSGLTDRDACLRNMAQARRVSRAAFDSTGKGAAKVDDITDLLTDSDNEVEPIQAKEDKVSKDIGKHSSKATPKPSPKKPTKEGVGDEWFQRDSRIADAMKEMTTWTTKTKTACKEVLASIHQIITAVPAGWGDRPGHCH